MKKLLFAVSIILFVGAISCKKESTTTTATQTGGLGTINVNIDGKAESFNPSVLVPPEINISNDYIMEIVGYQGLPGISNAITLIFLSTNPFKTGTIFSDSSSVNIAGMVYAQISDGAGYTNSYDGSTKITITSFNSTSVQGTFSGSLKGGTNPKIHTLTNGTFNVPIQ